MLLLTVKLTVLPFTRSCPLGGRVEKGFITAFAVGAVHGVVAVTLFTTSRFFSGALANVVSGWTQIRSPSAAAVLDFSSTCTDPNASDRAYRYVISYRAAKLYAGKVLRRLSMSDGKEQV